MYYVPNITGTYLLCMIDWIRQLHQSFDSVCWRRNSPKLYLMLCKYVHKYYYTTPWSIFFFCLLKAFLYWALCTTILERIYGANELLLPHLNCIEKAIFDLWNEPFRNFITALTYITQKIAQTLWLLFLLPSYTY